MSGGSFDYMYARIEQTYVGEMRDAEMDALMQDLVKVLHDLEWYTSGDITGESYHKSLKLFKDKWFTQSREDRLREIVKEECGKLKSRLMMCIGTGNKNSEDDEEK